MSQPVDPSSDPQPRGGGSELQVARIGLITALIVGLFGVTGAVINAFNSRAGLVVPIQATQTAESRLFAATPLPARPTQIEETSLPEATLPPVTVTPTSSPPASPTEAEAEELPAVQLVRSLDPENQDAVQTAAASILQVAELLPQLVMETFDSNSNGWSIFQDVFDQGIECKAALEDGQYRIDLLSTADSGAAWCLPFIPLNAEDFLLSVDADLTNRTNSDVRIYYRYSDDNNFNYLIIKPLVQTLTAGAVVEGEDHIHVQAVYLPSIKKDAANRVTLLSIGETQSIYLNGELEVLLTTPENPGNRQLRIGLRLHEADQSEELAIDNFDLRGN